MEEMAAESVPTEVQSPAGLEKAEMPKQPRITKAKLPKPRAPKMLRESGRAHTGRIHNR